MSFRDTVSRAELRVLDLLLEGLPNKAIANRIGVSEYTVKMHVKAMCLRAGTMNRTGLVLAASDGFAMQMAEMRAKNAELVEHNEKLRQLVLTLSGEIKVLERLLVRMNPDAAQLATSLRRVAA